MALLRQTQKLEVVGRVAGGVAHDFNNLLTTMLGCTALLEETARGDDAELVRDLREAAERAALMTRQLLAFSRKQVLRPEPVDLNAAVRAFQNVLQRLLRADVTVEVASAAGEATVLADRSGIEQVLLNLAVNARDAMPTGGTLRLQTRGGEGEEVVLEVSDTGVGMDEATRRRLFEPFFTTKPDGTGLGLPTVLGIVERSGGRIEVDSAPGRGTTFRLRFPRAQPAAAGAPPDPQVLRGEGRVLLVDDDAPVRATTRRLLENGGYEVREAATADEALAVLAQDRSFALVISDVVMPGLSGAALARRLAEDGHHVPVLFISGYAADHELGEAPVLAKPFRPEKLLEAVHRRRRR